MPLNKWRVEPAAGIEGQNLKMKVVVKGSKRNVLLASSSFYRQTGSSSYAESAGLSVRKIK
jgi:hypothetical protein